MKKLFLMFAVSMMTASVFAQNTAITSNKEGDNWYVGANVGVATPMFKYDSDHGAFKGFAPSFGVRIGKNLTTVFGLALDANMYFEASEKSLMKHSTFVDGINVDLMGTFNLTNAFSGYKGQPSAFEVIALIGGGYSRSFGEYNHAGVNAKVAFDFAYNFGSAKQWQAYIEPSLTLGQPLPVWANPLRKNAFDENGNKKFNGMIMLSAGINYKFGNTNGSHNFKIEQLRDQAEIDALQAKINELRADNNRKDGKIAADGKTIADLQAELTACKNKKPEVDVRVIEKTNSQLQPIVIFAVGKSTLDNAGYASCEMVAKYMRNHKDAQLLVRGYASPEGNAELNQKLSQARAEAVKNALVKRYKIAASRITAQGMGATDALSEELDFNRVAMFFDTTVK